MAPRPTASHLDHTLRLSSYVRGRSTPQTCRNDPVDRSVTTSSCCDRRNAVTPRLKRVKVFVIAACWIRTVASSISVSASVDVDIAAVKGATLPVTMMMMPHCPKGRFNAFSADDCRRHPRRRSMSLKIPARVISPDVSWRELPRICSSRASSWHCGADVVMLSWVR
jgi:hypothetical protein